jgi:hypothetical protein
VADDAFVFGDFYGVFIGRIGAARSATAQCARYCALQSLKQQKTPRGTMCPRFALLFARSEIGGRSESRMPAGTGSFVRNKKVKRTSFSHCKFNRTSGFPCAMDICDIHCIPARIDKRSRRALLGPECFYLH